MKKMKKVIVSVLVLAVLSLYSLSAFAAQTGCDHDWRLYEKTQVYSGTESCGEVSHKNCMVYVRGYTVRYRCSKCNNEKSGTYTEKEHQYYNF